jgi:hypothetical protein
MSGVEALMDKQQLVEELFGRAQDDWLALWMIAADVDVVRELLQRGLRAGKFL